MYAYIDGIVAEKTKDAIILEAGGIGYYIFVRMSGGGSENEALYHDDCAPG